MTEETDELGGYIQQIKQKHKDENVPHRENSGYSVAINILTDLFGCVLIGLGLGVLFQKVFDASYLVTAAFTMLGGIAGLWTVIRYGIALDKQKDDSNESDASV